MKFNKGLILGAAGLILGLLADIVQSKQIEQEISEQLDEKLSQYGIGNGQQDDSNS